MRTPKVTGDAKDDDLRVPRLTEDGEPGNPEVGSTRGRYAWRGGTEPKKES